VVQAVLPTCSGVVGKDGGVAFHSVHALVAFKPPVAVRGSSLRLPMGACDLSGKTNLGAEKAGEVQKSTTSLGSGFMHLYEVRPRKDRRGFGA
jgi:hypothetical protein